MHLFPISLALTPFPSRSHHLSLIHLFILPSSPCSPLGLSLSLCCISHTRWRHWVVYSYHLVGAFIFFTIHVLPSLSCKIFFSFNNLCSSFIVSLISPLDFLCFPLFDVESPFLLALACFFFHVNSSLIGHSLHNWSPLNVISLYTTFITLCCYSRPWTVTAFWFSVPERLSNHPSAELSFLNSFSPDANTLSSVFRIIYCMIWKSFHRRQISNGNLWCCFTFCYVLFF